MSSDFAVVINVRHRFGDQKEDQGFDGDRELLDVDAPAPFVGRVGVFDFACPDIDSTKQAILQFHYRGSEQGAAFPVLNAGAGLIGLVDDEHPVSINGHTLAGGVPACPTQNNLPAWGLRLLLIDGFVLKEDNVLQIESNVLYASGTLDDFTIDNAVVFYKTRGPRRPDVPASPGK